jgi:hypothetical protein
VRSLNQDQKSMPKNYFRANLVSNLYSSLRSVAESGSRVGLLCLSSATLSVLLLPIMAAAAPEVRFTGRLFDKDSNKQKLMFNYKSEIEKRSTDTVIVNTFTTPDGKTALIETAEFSQVEAGKERLRALRLSQKQTGAEGSVEIKDGKATFAWTVDGKTQTNTETAGDDFVAGPGILSYLQKNWGRILKGEDVDFRLAVLERRETVGFEFSKEKEIELGGQKAVIVKMKPSSLIIAALVKPLRFYVSADGQKLIELHGRTTVKQGSPGNWQDLDVVTVYDYPSTSK